MLKRDRIGANCVYRAQEAFRDRKSLGAHRTSTRRTLVTVVGIFELLFVVRFFRGDRVETSGVSVRDT